MWSGIEIKVFFDSFGFDELIEDVEASGVFASESSGIGFGAFFIEVTNLKCSIGFGQNNGVGDEFALERILAGIHF